MSYIAVDELGGHLFRNKPIRVHGKSFDYWADPEGSDHIYVPVQLARILYNNKMLGENFIPFDKRDMNWGDSPIYVSEISY